MCLLKWQAFLDEVESGLAYSKSIITIISGTTNWGGSWLCRFNPSSAGLGITVPSAVTFESGFYVLDNAHGVSELWAVSYLWLMYGKG